MILVFGLLGVLALLALFAVAYRNDKDRQERCMYAVLIAAVCAVAITVLRPSPTPQDYYLPAEIVAENEISTYFGCENGHIYYASRNPSWPDDVPYLLYMDSQGTKDPTDDTILVVWRTD